MWYESQISIAVRFWQLTEIWTGQSLLGTNKIGDSHSTWIGSMTSMGSTWSVFCFLNFLSSWFAWHGPEWVGQLPVLSSSIRCCNVLIEIRCPFHMLAHCERMWINVLQFAEYSSRIISAPFWSVLDFLSDRLPWIVAIDLVIVTFWQPTMNSVNSILVFDLGALRCIFLFWIYPRLWSVWAVSNLCRSVWGFVMTNIHFGDFTKFTVKFEM